MYCLDYVTPQNLTKAQNETGKEYYCSKALNILEIPDGVIVSGASGGPGVFSRSGYIEESNFHSGFGKPGFRKEEKAEESDEEVVFIGSFSGTWGHCITDNLKHLWILLNPDNRLNSLRFAYTMLTEEETLPEAFLEMVEVLGKSRAELVRIRGCAKFRKVYIPEPCFFCVPGGPLFQSGSRYYTSEYKTLIGRIAEHAETKEAPAKIYFTRTQLPDQTRDMGEKDIEDLFRDAGFAIVAPEAIGVFDQISLLKGCQTFATTQGSVSLNAVFCKPETEVILINKQNYITPYQLAVNHARGGLTTVIDANRSVLNPTDTPWTGPFFMYKSRELCRWAGIRYPGFPLIPFLKYLKRGLSDRNLRTKLFKNAFRRLISSDRESSK